MMRYPDCPACQGPANDPDLHRVQVWENDLWRLTTSLASEVEGFSYLEPKRHIPSIADLDGEEARTLGETLAATTTALKEAAGAEQIYIYVFGAGIPHLHLHLAPHRTGDALSDAMIRGDVVVQDLPSGAQLVQSEEFPPLPEATLRDTADRIRGLLAG